MSVKRINELIYTMRIILLLPPRVGRMLGLLICVHFHCRDKRADLPKEQGFRFVWAHSFKSIGSWLQGKNIMGEAHSRVKNGYLMLTHSHWEAERDRKRGPEVLTSRLCRGYRHEVFPRL